MTPNHSSNSVKISTYGISTHFERPEIIFFSGLKEVQAECKSLDIEFHLLIGNGEEVLPGFVEKHKIGAVVVDFMPLRECLDWASQLKKSLPEGVPLCQVRLTYLIAVVKRFVFVLFYCFWLTSSNNS